VHQARLCWPQLLCAPGRQDLHRRGKHLALHHPLARRRRAWLTEDKVHHIHAIDHVAENRIAGITPIRLCVQRDQVADHDEEIRRCRAGGGAL